MVYSWLIVQTCKYSGIVVLGFPYSLLHVSVSEASMVQLSNVAATVLYAQYMVLKK